MKKILTTEDKNFRPQLGAKLKRYAVQSLRATNTGNLSADWNTTDMARYFMAKGIEYVTGRPIPEDVLAMFKRFDKDMDL